MINLIIPMAGKGKRMRPHTLTTPKPFIPIAGQPIVKRLVQEIAQLYPGAIAHIGFVVQSLTPGMQAQLQAIAQSIGAQAHCYIQEKPLGTAHAISSAQELLKNRTIIAFSDTLFKSNSAINPDQENTIWVKKVKDPTGFGIVQLGQDKLVTHFIEKPTSFVSDLAIIGLYYFQEGLLLKKAIQQIIAQGIAQAGEYQLTDALMLMQQQGTKFAIQEVQAWLDCGNKAATLQTNEHFLECLQADKDLIDPSARLYNSLLIPPVYLGKEVMINNSIVGPYVSIGNYTQVTGSNIQKSLIQEHTSIAHANLKNSMIGNFVQIQGKIAQLDLGDYNTIID